MKFNVYNFKKQFYSQILVIYTNKKGRNFVITLIPSNLFSNLSTCPARDGEPKLKLVVSIKAKSSFTTLIYTTPI